MPANMDMAVVTKSTKLYTCGRNKIMRWASLPVFFFAVFRYVISLRGPFFSGILHICITWQSYIILHSTTWCCTEPCSTIYTISHRLMLHCLFRVITYKLSWVEHKRMKRVHSSLWTADQPRYYSHHWIKTIAHLRSSFVSGTVLKHLHEYFPENMSQQTKTTQFWDSVLYQRQI
jgi:hypothetical protein